MPDSPPGRSGCESTCGGCAEPARPHRPRSLTRPACRSRPRGEQLVDDIRHRRRKLATPADAPAARPRGARIGGARSRGLPRATPTDATVTSGNYVPVSYLSPGRSDRVGQETPGNPKSPLPDSNRRPLPYRAARPGAGERTDSGNTCRGVERSNGIVGNVAQRSAPALPTEYPGASTNFLIEVERESSASKLARHPGSPASRAGRGAHGRG